MGAPELPGDPGEEDLSSIPPNVQHAPIPSSDDSELDEGTIDAYNGYEPLAFDENGTGGGGGNDRIMTHANDDDDEDDTTSEQTEISATQREPPDFPYIESADVEIERAVWNAPRPQELEIELDNTRTQQILSAMSNFALPNVVVPDWVQDESWKEDLLQRIRQRKVLENDNIAKSNNQAK